MKSLFGIVWSIVWKNKNLIFVINKSEVIEIHLYPHVDSLMWSMRGRIFLENNFLNGYATYKIVFGETQRFSLIRNKRGISRRIRAKNLSPKTHDRVSLYVPDTQNDIASRRALKIFETTVS